ncbi:hypothetical protein HYW74_04810 [Candidatus Pacearchaeota archaeon]|nr:hypothetical protein [Candidatus Pacearchaeota archaeon]
MTKTWVDEFYEAEGKRRANRRDNMQYAWNIAKPILQYTEGAAIASVKGIAKALYATGRGIGRAASGTADLAVKVTETYNNAKRYEELNPEAVYTRMPEPTVEEIESKQSQFNLARVEYEEARSNLDSLIEGIKNRKDIIDPDEIDAIKRIFNQSSDYTKQKEEAYNESAREYRQTKMKGYKVRVGNVIRRIANIGENSRQYKGLEELSKKLSQESGEKVSPKYVFEKIKSEKERKQEEKRLNEYRKGILEMQEVLRSDTKYLTLENITNYNTLVSQHNSLCHEMERYDPRERFSQINIPEGLTAANPEPSAEAGRYTEPVVTHEKSATATPTESPKTLTDYENFLSYLKGRRTKREVPTSESATTVVAETLESWISEAEEPITESESATTYKMPERSKEATPENTSGPDLLKKVEEIAKQPKRTPPRMKTFDIKTFDLK